MTHRRFVVLTAAVACCLANEALAAESALVLVLDGSGSMWGRVGGSIKIVEAKHVTEDLLADVPTGVDLSVVAYGHRRKGDCTDIETIAAFGTPTATIAERVKGLTPLGKTPIADSLQKGADQLAGRGGPSTLVLVSDGIETCSGDPCALAETLRAGGADLVIHTVGFGVVVDAQRQLQCIAEKGGGHYYHADSGEALRKALFEVRDATARQEPPPPPPEAPKLPEVKVGDSQRIVVAGPGTIVLEPAPWVKMPPYRWSVADAETGEQRGRSESDRLRVKAGEYRLTWRQSEHYSTDIPLTEVVVVASKETVEVPIDTGLRLTAPEGIAAPYEWALRPADAPVSDDPGSRRLTPDRGDVAVFRDSLDAQVVPAGAHRLLWWQNEHATSPVDLGLIRILPGKLNDLVVGTGVAVQGADWIPGGDLYRYDLVDASGKSHGYWKSFGPQIAPAGSYRLRYRQSEHAHSPSLWGPVEVPAEGFATFVVDSGVRFVPQDQMPPPYKVFFVDLDTGEEISWSGKWAGKWEPVPVPPGRYRLDWHESQHETERMTLADEIVIPESTLVEIEL